MDAKDKRIAELEALLQAALERIAELEAEIAALKKNSANSSKPPSSDIVKPQKTSTPKGKKRKRGAQKSHKRNLRKPFEENQIDNFVTLDLNSRPACGGRLAPTGQPPKVHQQVELVDKPFIVTEYRQGWCRCEHCQCYHAAELPKEVANAGLFGPKLISLTAYLKGRGHMSYKTLRDFFADVLSPRVLTGFLAKQVRKVTDATEKPYEKLPERLPHEKHPHIDETGGKENGERRWTWCFRTGSFTVLHIDPSRSRVVLETLLGKDYAGTISCDFWARTKSSSE